MYPSTHLSTASLFLWVIVCYCLNLYDRSFQKPFLSLKTGLMVPPVFLNPLDIPGYMLGSMRRTEKWDGSDCIQEVVIKKGHFLKIILKSHGIIISVYLFSLPLGCKITEASDHILVLFVFLESLELSTIPVNSRCLKYLCHMDGGLGAFSKTGSGK